MVGILRRHSVGISLNNLFSTTWASLRDSDLYHPIVAFLVTRLIVIVGAYVGEIAIPGIEGDGTYHVAKENVFLDVWARWDSGFYLTIIERGYEFVPGEMSNAAFFPLFPLLTSVMNSFTDNILLAGVLVSHLMLFLSLLFIYKLAKFEFDAGTARRSIYYIAAFPTAFYFSAFYTESTFLFVSVATVYFARRRMWAWATLFAMLATVTRIIGLGVWGIVGLEWLRLHGWTLSTAYQKQAWLNLLDGLRKDWANLLLICSAPLGVASHMLFLSRAVGDPIAFWSVQSAWGREDLGPIAIVLRDVTPLFSQNFLAGDIWWHVIFDVGSLFLVLLLVWPIYKQLGEGMAIFALLGMLIPASSGSGSLMRYIVVLFPVFIILGKWGQREPVDRMLTIGFSVLLGVFTTIFVNWIFVA